MLTGSTIGDLILILAAIWAGSCLVIPILMWIEYRRDCKRYGKDKVDEMWRRRR